MKKELVPIIFSLIFVTACEVDIPYEDTSGLSNISLNAYAVEEVPFTAYVTESFFFMDTVDTLGTDDRPMIWHSDSPGRKPYKLPMNEWSYYLNNRGNWTDDIDPVFYGSILREAEVKLKVNSTVEYRMQYDEGGYCFRSDYMPSPGDHLEITAQEGDRTVFSFTEIPQRPHVEITKIEKKGVIAFDEVPGWYSGACDTLVRIHCRIPEWDDNGFYRVHCDVTARGGDYIYYDDIYYSPSDVFYDKRLTSNWFRVQPNFCPAFRGSMLNGSEGEFFVDIIATADTYFRPQVEDTEIGIEIQRITKDLFLFIRSYMLYRITERDRFAAPVSIPTNVEGGDGIVSGISTERITFKMEEIQYTGDVTLEDCPYFEFYYQYDEEPHMDY